MNQVSFQGSIRFMKMDLEEEWNKMQLHGWKKTQHT